MGKYDDLIARLEDGDQYVDAVDDAIHAIVTLRDRVSELERTRGDINLSQPERSRLLQWFRSLQDVNPKYLEPEDYALAQKIIGGCNG